MAALCLALAGCGDGRDDAYPSLRPLEELTQPPRVPDHAADALADPRAVEGELRARSAAARAPAAPIADRAALDRRAADLRQRAAALRKEEAAGNTSPCPSAPDPSRPDCRPH